VDDITAWCLLALIVGVAHASLTGALLTLTLSAFYVAGMIVLVRPLVRRWVARMESQRGVTRSVMAFVFFALLASALATSAIGIHALFGAR
jgi:Kef-type K+ transport system membrane component KefB